MSDRKSFLVDIIGIPDHERNVLKSIFKLSLYRANAFIFASTHEPCRILIVDADDPEAMAKWRIEHHPGESIIPTVMVTKEKQSSVFPCCIHRPFVATRVLGVMDQIAAELSAQSQEQSVSEESPAISDREAQDVLPAATVLVVDDSSTIRKQLELELKLFDVHVDTAESGEQVFDLIAHKTYDIIFLDVVLPGMDGYQVCRMIKRDKDKRKIPVVMLTSKSSPFDRVRGALAGCDTYLTKPVKQVSFHKVVKKYLDSR